jgi:hypothetical protein
MSDDYASETVWAREVEALRSYLEDCHEPLYAGRSATQELRAIAARFEGAETDQERDRAVKDLAAFAERATELFRDSATGGCLSRHAESLSKAAGALVLEERQEQMARPRRSS